LLRIICVVFFRLRVFGVENVPKRGPFILACNHQSYLDPILCGVRLKRRLWFLARESLFGNWFFRRLICSLGALPLKPGRADVHAFRTVLALLKEGKGICLFPEGTRTSDGRIAMLKPGLGLLCRRGNAVIVPAVIDGAFECWPRDKKMFSFGPIRVAYGEPIRAEQALEVGDEEFAELLTETLRRMQNELRSKAGKEPFSY